MNIVNRIKVKCHLAWNLWGIPFYVCVEPHGVTIGFLCCVVIVTIGCAHKWKVYHRHGKAYRRCLRPNCEAWETVEGGLPMIEMPVINPGSTTTSASQSSLYELPEESKES